MGREPISHFFGVSIRARARGLQQATKWEMELSDEGFNSRPRTRAATCVLWWYMMPRVRRFQFAPAHAGCNVEPVGNNDDAPFVSIRARARGLQRDLGFSYNALVKVSIRARARGLQQVTGRFLAQILEFQFAPAHAGCNVAEGTPNKLWRYEMFQFAPAHAGCNA